MSIAWPPAQRVSANTAYHTHTHTHTHRHRHRHTRARARARTARESGRAGERERDRDRERERERERERKTERGREPWRQLTARSLSKKSVASATSSGSANLPSGIDPIIGARLAGSFHAS